MKKISLMFIALISITIWSCLSNSDTLPVDLYLKKLQIKKAEVQWYYHSLITSRPPDWVVIKYDDGFIDTLCQADNIGDVSRITDDTIKIYFHSSPTQYLQPTEVKNRSRNFVIELDTNGIVLTDSMRAKMTFKK